MFRNYDIIILSSSRWDDNFSSSALSLAKEFAKHNRVYFIDHPFSIKDFVMDKSRSRIRKRVSALLFGKRICRKVESFPVDFNVVTPMLTLPINWLREGKFYNFLSRLNDRVLHIALRKIIKQCAIKKYILINIFDPFFLKNIPDDIKPEINIYYTVDDISQEEYIARHGIRLERDAIVKADFCFATSRELTRLKAKFSDNIFYLPNAADATLFKKAVSETLTKPEELRNTNKRVICYTGVIGTRINYQLLKEVALYHHEKLLLLVGPFDIENYKQSGLANLSNVIFTGPKDIKELPAYLKHSDVTIIPFEYSLLTKSIYPLKINEYLAAGKPVVSTAFSADIMDFENVAYIADTNQKFISSIDVAITENSIEKIDKRIEKAEGNTWQSRVNTFWKIIENKRLNRVEESLKIKEKAHLFIPES